VVDVVVINFCEVFVFLGQVVVLFDWDVVCVLCYGFGTG